MTDQYEVVVKTRRTGTVIGHETGIKTYQFAMAVVVTSAGINSYARIFRTTESGVCTGVETIE
jgi:hypothetical protein